jgi:hypothetical protein
MRMDELEEERGDWARLAAAGLARAYGDDEPEYGPDDVLADPASTGSSSLPYKSSNRGNSE